MLNRWRAMRRVDTLKLLPLDLLLKSQLKRLNRPGAPGGTQHEAVFFIALTRIAVNHVMLLKRVNELAVIANAQQAE